MSVDAGLYMCDVVKKSSRSLSHLLMSSCFQDYGGRPSAILDLWDTFLDHPRRVLGVLISVQNLVGISAVVLITEKLEYFGRLA